MILLKPSLAVSAIQRFVQPETISSPKLVLIVGSVGLGINLLGLVFFHEHDHHGHSHQHGQDHESAKDEEKYDGDCDNDQKGYQRNLNMRGVFLHFLGDALGSVAVMISAIVNLLLDSTVHAWLSYIDPLVSLVITLILVRSSYPLMRSTLSILLQNAPEHVDMAEVKREILSLKNVVGLHEFHVWYFLALMHF